LPSDILVSLIAWPFIGAVHFCMEVLMRPRVSPRRLFAFAALTLTLAGCAGTGAGGAASGPRRGTTTRIVADELAGVAEMDLFGAISRLRPNWLRAQSRGTMPRLIIDGTPQPEGSIEMLRSMRVSDAGELQYMSASDATTRYGTGYPAGAILVTTKR
jgi:hypothetical protein